MAKMTIQMPDELQLKMSKLGSDFDRTAEKVLQAGGEVVLSEVKKSLSDVVGKDTKYSSRIQALWVCFFMTAQRKKLLRL